MLKRNDIVSSTNIWDLTTVVAGSAYQNTLNDLQSITVDIPNFNTIKQIILAEFDEQDVEVIEVNTNIASAGTYRILNTTIESIIGLSAVIPNPWSEATPTWTIDPDGVSNLGANLINGNLTDLCYNNLSTWSVNKSLPAIDLGSSLAIDKIDLYRRSTTYLSTNFKIQGSNDWTTRTDVVTNQQSTAVWLQSIPVTGTYRYWRLFNVTWTNATYVVLSEMKAFTVWVWSTTLSMTNNSEVSLIRDWNDVIVTNNTSQWLDFIINYLI